MGKRYVAYVGSYTFIGKSKGITIYDVDVEAGRFTRRDEVEINNSSYLAVSHSRKYLYSVVDEGIASFRILEDGGLEQMNIVITDAPPAEEYMDFFANRGIRVIVAEGGKESQAFGM